MYNLIRDSLHPGDWYLVLPDLLAFPPVSAPFQLIYRRLGLFVLLVMRCSRGSLVGCRGRVSQRWNRLGLEASSCYGVGQQSRRGLIDY